MQSIHWVANNYLVVWTTSIQFLFSQPAPLRFKTVTSHLPIKRYADKLDHALSNIFSRK